MDSNAMPTDRAIWPMVLCYPRALGWGARVGLLLYVVADQVLNTQRVSEVEIRAIDALDEYTLFQIGMSGLFGLYLTLYFIRTSITRVGEQILHLYMSTPLRWIAMYIAFAFASAIWSEAPLLTGFKAAQCMVFMLTATIAIVGLRDLDERIRYLVVTSLAYLTMAYVCYGIWKVPDEGPDLISLHFVVGTVPFLGTLFLVKVGTLKNLARLYWWLMLPFVVIETVLSSFVGLAAAQIMRSYMLSRTLLRCFAPLVAVLLVVSLIMLLPEDPDAVILGIKSVEEITGGTGRFEVWKFALEKAFWESPIVGHSFVLGDAIGRTSGINPALGQMHNAHLSALMNLGVVGAWFWLMFLLGSYHAIANHPNREVRAALAATALVYAFHQMLGGASLSSPIHVVWISHAFFFSIVALEATDFKPRRPLRTSALVIPHPQLQVGEGFS